MAKTEVEEILWCHSFLSDEQAVIVAGSLISPGGLSVPAIPFKVSF